MIFFTADTHFCHTNILQYCNRPFKTVEEMDETIISNWNACVNDSDTVYHCGDFAFRNPEEYLKRLKGRLVLILGNHDYKRIRDYEKLVPIHDLLSIKIEDVSIVLCHYSMRVWPKSHFNAWNLYGHSHGTLDDWGKSYDVGVDKNGFTPLSFEQLKEIMKTKLDNFNWLKSLKGYNEKEFQEVKQIDKNDSSGELVE